MGQVVRAQRCLGSCALALLFVSRAASAQQAPAPGPDDSAATVRRGPLSEDFAIQSSPWVDVTLTSLWLEERTSGFWNVGVQPGGYLFERLRWSVRLVVPLGHAEDEAYNASTGVSTATALNSREVSVFYGASLGVVVAATRSFAFAPSLFILRTDVGDYGTSVGLALPFDWVTSRSMRVGFEFDAGSSFGGQVHFSCQPSSVACSPSQSNRPTGTAIGLQFYMGWSLGML
jgi:hypothetical protein